jgi:Na+-translocating ferredoxin:NAD+ oxidoreductase RnfG subunit
MKQSVKSTLVLFLICAVMAVLLALTNAFTAPKIQANLEAAANEALLVVMPEGKDFKKMDISSYTLPATVTEAYSEAGGGYVITITTSGYGSNFIIMCGVSADGKVTGSTCLSSSETLGHEKTYGANFIGKNTDDVMSVDTVGGATKTTAAYRDAVKLALDAFNTLSKEDKK